MQGNLEEGIDKLNTCIKKDDRNPIHYYNRALMHLEGEDYLAALADLEQISSLGHHASSELKRRAYNIKKKSDQKKLSVLVALAHNVAEDGKYDLAHSYYDQAMLLSEDNDYLLFTKAQLGLLQKNPFIVLEHAESINTSRLSQVEKKELNLIKAYNLARVNRIKEAIALLEDLVYFDKDEDPRPRQLLSYYYLRLSQYDKAVNVLKGQVYMDPNTYMVAGNAALYQKKYTLAERCFDKVKYLDPQNVNADIGRALCYAQTREHRRATQLIDSLATSHPDNHYVLNTKGIVYKDVGLHHRNNFNNRKSEQYLLTAASAFMSAQTINENLKASFQSNRALALFFLNKNQEAKTLWLANNEMSSQNNLALLYASKKDYKRAYQKLDSLYQKAQAKYKKKNSLIEYNRKLARSRTRLNNNYRFITNYFLTQDKPKLEVENPFMLPVVETEQEQDDIEYILEYSHEDCTEKLERKKVKKKKKFRLFKRKKKKKSKGDCPTF